MKKAYRVWWRGIAGIVAATSPGQARAKMVRQGQDAGYKPKFPDVTAKRVPQYDEWAEQDQSGYPWSEEHLKPLARN